MTDPLLAWRAEFPILRHTTYLISHSLGAMPRQVRDRLAEFADTWATRGIRAWSEGWWTMPVTVGNLVGSIIGAGPGQVVMHQNTSICQSLVLSCLNWNGQRNKIVTEALNFPSNLYIFHALQAEGARVVTVPSVDGATIDLETLLDAIDEETQLVSVSHVLFKSSFVQDLAAIVAKAHAVGAYVFADLYQSAGTLPVNVKELGVDFAAGGSVKWLLGGPGAGYLYVRRDLWSKLRPRLTGWCAHAHPFAFEAGSIDYADDIMRFTHGSPAIPTLYSAQAGYQIIQEVGVPAIREKSLRQTKLLLDLADDAAFPVFSPRAERQRGGTLVLEVPHGAQVVKELQAREFLVDYRPGAGIRISAHFYTEDDELRAVIREIQKILGTKAYERHDPGASH